MSGQHGTFGSSDHRGRRRDYELRHGSPAQQEAMDKLRDMFQVTRDQLNVLVRGFEEEMRAGLADDSHDVATRSSDLKMIPSYVTGYPTGNEQGTYLALEISGVDIYVCQVKLKGEGGKLAINQYQYEIPDDLTAGDDFNVLTDYVADCISDFQRRVSMPQGPTYSMGISVGFAVRQTGLDRGTVMALEHGFEFPNVVGGDIIELFHDRFRAKGLNVRIVAIANDGVCTLLAHAYQHPATRVGIVHGAGTNCAYYDRVSNMRRFLAQQRDLGIDVASLEQEVMIVNTEWCNFGSRYLPMSVFDHRLDRDSNNRGIHSFEKMTTGMYLGEIVRYILVELVEHAVVSFRDEDGLLRTPYHFDTSYMYVCEADNDDEELEDTRVVLEDMCKVGKTSLADREIVKYVCELVGHRAAMVVGASIASVVKYMPVAPEDGFTIAISGEVYKDYPNFHPRVCETLKALIPDDISSRLSVGIVKFSRIVGAAVVAMMAEKQTSSS